MTCHDIEEPPAGCEDKCHPPTCPLKGTDLLTRVEVIDPDPYFSWGEFNYCAFAIQCDRARGFTVIEDNK